MLELTAADELVALENMDVLQQNGFEVAVEEDQPAGRRLKLIAQPVSKNTEFDTQGCVLLRPLVALLNLTFGRSGGDPALAERSTCGYACTLVEDTCDVCHACVSQEHDGRRAAQRQADDDRESSFLPTPRFHSQRTRIDRSIRFFDPWDRWSNRGTAHMAGLR